MTAREMQIAFDAQIQLAGKDYEISQKPDSYTVFYYINQAQERLVKTRYSGLNAKGESFEQTQKRTEDLRTLVKEVNISIQAGSFKPNSYVASLPQDYFIAVGEEVTIQIGVEEKRRGITDCTSDTYSNQITDPYSAHLLHFDSADPLRLFTGATVELITDGNYNVTSYHLRYIKFPNTIKLPDVGESNGADSELPVHMHSEIVTKAVNLFLEAAADPRYQSSKNELREQE